MISAWWLLAALIAGGCLGALAMAMVQVNEPERDDE